jgi:hypothetical protein
VGDLFFWGVGDLALHRPLQVFFGVVPFGNCLIEVRVGVEVPCYSLFISMPVGMVFWRGVSKLKYRDCTER